MKIMYSEATYKITKVLIRCLLGGDQESLPQKRGWTKWRRMLKG